ncbi:MAG: hypothetical protein M3O70_14670 [Actinomycetota bacterium]|nr:hypothetical protein [Actinomycetota bacterium]
MRTRLLDQRPSLLEEARLEAIIEQAGLAAAWNTVGERGRHRLEIVVDEWAGPVLEVSANLAHACGIALAAALLERQGTDWERWAVRVLEWDEVFGASILLHEWRSQAGKGRRPGRAGQILDCETRASLAR